jgi:hypothetical protein
MVGPCFGAPLMAHAARDLPFALYRHCQSVVIYFSIQERAGKFCWAGCAMHLPNKKRKENMM